MTARFRLVPWFGFWITVVKDWGSLVRFLMNISFGFPWQQYALFRSLISGRYCVAVRPLQHTDLISLYIIGLKSSSNSCLPIPLAVRRFSFQTGFASYALFSFFFCFAKKRNKKRRPKSITARFRRFPDLAMYYCGEGRRFPRLS